MEEEDGTRRVKLKTFSSDIGSSGCEQLFSVPHYSSPFSIAMVVAGYLLAI